MDETYIFSAMHMAERLAVELMLAVEKLLV